MGKKDVISKEILKNIARDISKHILHIDIKDDMEIINQEFTRVESRESDLLFQNGDEVVHIEIQNNNHKQMHLRMLRYYSDILFLYEKYKVSQYLVYIGKVKCNMKSTIKRDKIAYSYDIIKMDEIDCEELIQSNDSSAIALSILCDFKGQDKQSVVNRILLKLRELNDDNTFEKYLEIVTLYSTNRCLEENVKKGVEMLTVDIEKTPFYKIGVEKGREEEKEKGIEKGVLLVAKQMLKMKMDIDTIAKVTNLSKEKLYEIKKTENI